MYFFGANIQKKHQPEYIQLMLIFVTDHFDSKYLRTKFR